MKLLPARLEGMREKGKRKGGEVFFPTAAHWKDTNPPGSVSQELEKKRREAPHYLKIFRTRKKDSYAV